MRCALDNDFSTKPRPSTLVSFYFSPMQTLRPLFLAFVLCVPFAHGAVSYSETASQVTLTNGVLTAVIEKASGSIVSLKKGGTETVSQAGKTKIYFDWTSSAGFETMNGCVFSVKSQSSDIVDLSFKRVYNSASHLTPADIDIHYVLKTGDNGLYTYSIANHPASYPALDLGSWRMVWWIGHDGTDYLANYIAVDSLRQWEMPKRTDTYNATAIAEIIQMTSGARTGDYDGKYEYSKETWTLDAYGHTSATNNIGLWVVQGGFEYYNGGPTSQDLNSAAGIIHVCMNGLHYNSPNFTIAGGETWSKVWGPYLLYITDKSGVAANWADAKARAVNEKAQWPYSWLANTPEYPLTAGRGSVTGTFALKDSQKSALTSAGFWIGVTQLSNAGNDWQFEGRNYQYWAKVNADGTFSIPAVRPGTYSLFAFGDGAVGEYRLDNVTVTAGSNTNVGALVRTIDRSGYEIAWEIGTPDRSAKEFKFGGKEYANGFIYNQFVNTFANPLEYNVAEKNWATAFPYAHSKMVQTDGTTLAGWEWNLNFNLDTVPPSGNARLTIAYAGSDYAQQWIRVNSATKTFAAYYPPIAGGNALQRQSNHAKYCSKEISIPVANLKKGANVITLVMPSNSGMTSHHMYDYLSLEMPEVNYAPVLGGPGNYYVAENTVYTTAITQLAATDVDGDALTYTLGGTDAAQFLLSPSTRNLYLAKTPDYEAPRDANGDNMFEITITVSDGKLSTTVPLYILVGNIEESDAPSTGLRNTAPASTETPGNPNYFDLLGRGHSAPSVL